MKKYLLVVFLTLYSFNSYSQITFDKGFFIDNTGQKTECLIKNIDWKNNPTKFEYKLTESSESKTATIASVKEFGVYKISKYKRFTVDIDRSSENTDDLSIYRRAQFNQEELFLKILIEGKATLYYYGDSNLHRFFYHVDNKNVKQLVFKSYKTSNDKIGKNEAYKQELFHNLICHDITESYINKVDYKKK